MLKKGWNKIIETLKQGSIGFAARRLSAQEIKRYEKLLKEQRCLAEKASKTLRAYDQKMKKIQMLLGKARKGDVSRVASYIKRLQTEMDSALSKAELAAAETADLQREMADWQHRAKAGGHPIKDERWDMLVSELQSRGFLVAGQIPDRTMASDESSDAASVPYREDESNDTTDTNCAERLITSAVVYPQNHEPNCLACDPEQISARIKELSHEIELNQQWPGTTDAESLRLAKQIRNLNQVMKIAGKGSG